MQKASPLDPAECSAAMNVVPLAVLEARLQSTTPSDLLHELATSDELLQSPAVGWQTALVSYRQERRSTDQLTLDGGALLGLVTAAKRCGVDAFWLDAWCFRFEGECTSCERSKLDTMSASSCICVRR
jgi:hypothetical protein